MFASVAKFANFAKFQKFQLDNLVDFEKCCKTHIFLQKSVPIQRKTSNILPKFCQKLANFGQRKWQVARALAQQRGAPVRPPELSSSRRFSSVRRRPRSTAAYVFYNCLYNFANFWRARSRLYQNEILQENMRLTAFFKLYKICILLHRCNLKVFAKNRFEKSEI